MKANITTPSGQRVEIIDPQKKTLTGLRVDSILLECSDDIKFLQSPEGIEWAQKCVLSRMKFTH